MPWIDLPANYAPPAVQPSLVESKRWWEFRDQADADEAELLIFSEVGGWFGIYAEEFVEQLNAVTARKLTVRVNSPGGSVFQGVAIANALRAHPASVTVRVEGLAASIASVIALAGDRLVMAPNSMFMIHDASGATWGDAAEMRKMAEILDKISDNIADAYAAKAGGTRADWRSLMLAETWYTADEAVEAGLADELMVPPQREDEPDDAAKRLTARWDLSVFRYAGRENAPTPAGRQAHAAAVEAERQAWVARMDAAINAAIDQAPATGPPSPIPAHPHPTASEQPEPAPATPEPGPAEPDDWAALVAHFLHPEAALSAEELLAHLREA